MAVVSEPGDIIVSVVDTAPTPCASTVPLERHSEKNNLPKANLVHLWGLGVGAAISGDFFGWNFGLAHGIGSMLIALGAESLMYWCLVTCIAYMSSLYPTAGGASLFGRRAFGRWGAFGAGVAQSIEYVLAPPVIVTGIIGYIYDTFGFTGGATAEHIRPVWWLLIYVVFATINIFGVSASLNFGVVVSALSVLAILGYDTSAAVHVNFSQHAGPWFPESAKGVFVSLPFAMWFFLAVEELPLAVEEAKKPVRDIPRAAALSLLTLTVTAFYTLITFSASPPGSAAMSTSNGPAFLSLNATYASAGSGAQIAVKVMSMPAIFGLVASMHSITYAYGRQVQSMALQGFLPRALGHNLPQRNTPWAAIVAGSVFGYVVLLILYFADASGKASAVLLNMSVFGAVLSYIIQLASFFVLFYREHKGTLTERPPEALPPMRPPLGIVPGIVALVICLITLVCLFISDTLYLCVVPSFVESAYTRLSYAILGVVVLYVACLVYWLVSLYWTSIMQCCKKRTATVSDVGSAPQTQNISDTANSPNTSVQEDK